MSIQQYGLRFICDLCGITEDGPVPPPGLVRFLEEPIPGQWTSLDGLTLCLRDLYGASVMHLCPGCSRLDIGQVAARLRSKIKETTVG